MEGVVNAVAVPTLYRRELARGRTGLWWPGVPTRCATCRGVLWIEDDRVSCCLCGRDAYEVKERRLEALPTALVGRDGRYRAHWSPERKAAAEQRKAQRAAERAAGLRPSSGHRRVPCRAEGCAEKVEARKASGLCREHWALSVRGRAVPKGVAS
jgi:hypothetical protein